MSHRFFTRNTFETKVTVVPRRCTLPSVSLTLIRTQRHWPLKFRLCHLFCMSAHPVLETGHVQLLLSRLTETSLEEHFVLSSLSHKNSVPPGLPPLVSPTHCPCYQFLSLKHRSDHVVAALKLLQWLPFDSERKSGSDHGI